MLNLADAEVPPLMAWLQDRYAVRPLERMPSLLVSNSDMNSPEMVRLPLLVESADHADS